MGGVLGEPICLVGGIEDTIYLSEGRRDGRLHLPILGGGGCQNPSILEGREVGRVHFSAPGAVGNRRTHLAREEGGWESSFICWRGGCGESPSICGGGQYKILFICLFRRAHLSRRVQELGESISLSWGGERVHVSGEEGGWKGPSLCGGGWENPRIMA